jgi:hypothetical protein
MDPDPDSDPNQQHWYLLYLFPLCMYGSSELLLLSTGVFESKLMEMTDPEARKAYLDETKCTSVLDKIIVQVLTFRLTHNGPIRAS